MNWQKFKDFNFYWENLNLYLDISRVNFPQNFFSDIEPNLQLAFKKMQELEVGAISNIDENRMVGHYWLRNSELSPTPDIKEDIDSTIAKIKTFAKNIHNGQIQGNQGKFENLLCIGIGGSALGPQFVSDALGSKNDKLNIYFLDNTDPDGFDRIFEKLDGQLGKTLCIVTSKSGTTPEPRNAMIETQCAYKNANLDFAKHAVVITGENSKLFNQAKQEGFLDIFAMWDFVGGRTSEFSAVGLLPAALQGIDIDQFLEGAFLMDEQTRVYSCFENPAALLSAMWFFLTNGKGEKDMVVLPYKDRLILFSRYLQQLIMESLGKKFDLDGNIVNQGISVYGNKGSTDQHAYIQQLREGVDNFFALFIEVLKARNTPSIQVEDKITSSDFLQGFFLGTRDALTEENRQSITITIKEISPKTVGMLIALFDRAVGFYADMVNINAYHQPGVEAGKKAAGKTLEIRKKIIDFFDKNDGKFTSFELAQKISLEKDTEIIFKMLLNMTENSSFGITKEQKNPFYETLFFKNNK